LPPISRTRLRSSGNLPVSSLEYIGVPSTSTSKAPPEEGTRATSLRFVLYASNTFCAKLAALGRYPQDVQYLISTLLTMEFSFQL